MFGCGECLKEMHRNHVQALTEILERCLKNNLKLNIKKVQLCKIEVSYLGEVLSAEELKVDPKKIQAILEMLVPKDKKVL